MLPSAIEGSILTQIFTWADENGNIIDLTGTTITGYLQPADTPGDLRAIAGTLAVTDGAAGKFSWTYAIGDTEAGIYLVQFTAQRDGSVLHSFSDYWIVEPILPLHPYSLHGLRKRLMDTVAPVSSNPTPVQYANMVREAINTVSVRVPQEKMATITVMSGTDTYDLPVDFLFEIRMEALVGPDGVGYDMNGFLMVSSANFTERHIISGLTLKFVPTPAYGSQRRIWYAASYQPDENGIYIEMTESIAQLVLLKAEELVLKSQAQDEATRSGGFSYQFGDVRVDKKEAAGTLQKQAQARANDFERAVAEMVGLVGRMG